MDFTRYCQWSAYALIAASLVSCASKGQVKEHRLPIVGSRIVQRLINPEKLTDETRNLLKEEGLLRWYKHHPTRVVVALRKKLDTQPSTKLRLALVEVCSDTGERLLDRNNNRAMGFHLAAAEIALQGSLQKGSSNTAEAREQLLGAYDYSCGRVARILFESNHDWSSKISVEGPDKTYQLSCRTQGAGLVEMKKYDEIWAAENLTFDEDSGLQRVLRDGFGGALVLHRKWTEQRAKEDPLLSKMGLAMPVTATLNPVGKDGAMDMSFHDVLVTEKTQLQGRAVSLKADFTAPLAVLYSYEHWKNVGLAGLFHPERNLGRLSLFKLEEFREDQIPVILVHGLMSSPATWAKAVNSLRADPVLRERYQPLLFFYPTGFPIAYNADQLRTYLKNFRQTLDPQHKNPDMSQIVIIGHSMGGILSNAQIRSNHGDVGASGQQLGEMGEKEKLVREALANYEANPDIARAVFVATPHRGSDIAQKSVGGIVSHFIKFPGKVLTQNALTQGLLSMGSTLSGLDLNIDSKHFNGIESLKPDAPDLAAILEQPIRSGVRVHSIIARADPTVPLEESNDEVVDYKSAHLNSAVSEKVVHAKHMTINRNDDAIEEVRRILYLHAGLSYTPTVKKQQLEKVKNKRASKRRLPMYPSRRRP
ncbi:MAG: hypothetical protein L3J39_03800 [Verrucomicrobiales bacterium]|nr:hypothetical protein [Verrucomicrobiales bacterium]